MTHPTLTDLLGPRPLSAWSPDELMGKAHWRWDRLDHHAAFLLFEAAAEQARALGQTTNEDAARNRAAITLHRSGVHPEAARGRLEALLADYAQRPHPGPDRHFTEWAATALLEESTDAETLTAAFTRLGALCAAAGCLHYPNIHPQQETLAHLARRLGAREVLRAVTGRMRQRALKRALRVQVEAWERWLDG